MLVVLLVALCKPCNRARRETFANSPTLLRNRNVYVDKSCTGGFGVFAARDIPKGEVVETCPILVGRLKEDDGLLADYTFQRFDGKRGSVLGLGYCSLYNHVPDGEEDVSYDIDERNRVMRMTAQHDIKKGTEIMTSYGSDWWSSRELQPSGRCPAKRL